MLDNGEPCILPPQKESPKKPDEMGIGVIGDTFLVEDSKGCDDFLLFPRDPLHDKPDAGMDSSSSSSDDDASGSDSEMEASNALNFPTTSPPTKDLFSS
mmetsp:Transcript_4509/g.6784  ORF Transcript_4509/g.6784 Transcript_4509/m.6784 type:complete len:99 (+) Transcript_4509:445-741(+)